MRRTGLTRKQRKAIPQIVGASTIEAGCKLAGLAKSTFYKWLRDPDFRAEFDRQGDEVADAAFRTLRQNVERCVVVLVSLLVSADDRVKRLAANDLLGHFEKFRELQELEGRLAKIEETLRCGRRPDWADLDRMTIPQLEAHLRELRQETSEDWLGLPIECP